MAEKFPKQLLCKWVLDSTIKEDGSKERFYINLETRQKLNLEENIFNEVNHSTKKRPLVEGVGNTVQGLPPYLPAGSEGSKKFDLGESSLASSVVCDSASDTAYTDSASSAVSNALQKNEAENHEPSPKRAKIKYVPEITLFNIRRTVIRNTLDRLKEEARAERAARAAESNGRADADGRGEN
ncbi:uncharacterized protein LOC131165232 [Malania oleifera]|uniref:uncharacterized protein LOC131165232 n=1 Tax=Malania oleifera TaxID=397392 RepID=UPI0025AE3238|nr:uncharacterized protein LOC131165232 [Malania oleifera]